MGAYFLDVFGNGNRTYLRDGFGDYIQQQNKEKLLPTSPVRSVYGISREKILHYCNLGFCTLNAPYQLHKKNTNTEHCGVNSLSCQLPAVPQIPSGSETPNE